MLLIPNQLREIADREGGDLRDWVADLPKVVTELAQRWVLHIGEPYEPGGQCSWVAPAYTSTGEDVVLKLGWRHPEAEHEADGLRAWDGDGAVRLHAAATFDQTSALLLERCVPGTPLTRSMPESEQDAIVAGLLHRLWVQPPEGHPFRSLGAMCEEWASQFEQHLAAWTGKTAAADIDAGLTREAMTLLRELPSSAETSVLLCTDLHSDNILASRREPWLVIDPKPHVGDPTYDALQYMITCDERVITDPEGLIRRIANLLDLDADRLRLWLFTRCIHHCLDQPTLYDVATRIAP